MGTHDADDDVKGEITQAPFRVSKALLQMIQGAAVVQHDFLGRFASTAHDGRVGLDLGDGGFEHAHVADDELEVLASQALDAGDGLEGAEDALGDKDLDNCGA